MRKCLLFAALLIVSQVDCLKAQSTFEAPDTVCVRQPVQLTTNTPDVATHYWGFCSAYLLNNPVGVNLGKTPYDVAGPTDMDVVKVGDNYFGFLISSKVNEFKRLEFGNDLHNVPKVTNYGNFDNALPLYLNSLYIVYDSVKKNWHIFVCGGNDPATSELARIDFGNSLTNVPNIVNFGNIGSVLNAPHGIFIAREGDRWYGYLMNKTTSELIRLTNIDTNISLTPINLSLGVMTQTAGPHDLAAWHENGNWYWYITNEANNSFTRMDVGLSLDLTIVPPQDNSGPKPELFGPNGITLFRDCDAMYAFITNRQSHELVRVQILAVTDPTASHVLTNFGSVGGLQQPANISRMIRDKDDVIAFIPNYSDSTITRAEFAQCLNSSIPHSTTKRPPVYSYNAPGIYNIYYATNEGTPYMHVECKRITVLAIPPMELSNDTTICQGDTVLLRALSITALNVSWTPSNNISATDAIDVRAWPDYTTQYRIVLPYSNGCIVDTSIDVTVRKVKADAGPDRTLADGASTLLGGPYTSLGKYYAYTWKPQQYIKNELTPNASVNPPDDYTYYLEVEDTAGCRDIDTVFIHVVCNDINLPNAFTPAGDASASTSTFGILNRSARGQGSIIKLNYFRIFDRWGKMVFSTTDISQRWDGTVNGSSAEPGVYVWDVDGFCATGERLHKSGNVTLIR